MRLFVFRTIALYAIAAVLTGCVVVVPNGAQNVGEALAKRPVAPLTAFTTRDAAGNLQVLRLPVQCMPVAPPISAMTREKTSVVEGRMVAVLRAEGIFDSVSSADVVPASLKSDVEQLFRESTRAFPCRMPRIAKDQVIEMPFTFRLE